MILYKYRSFQNIDHILDILCHSRLYCAKYWELNDPFEGLFLANMPVYPLLQPFIKEHVIPKSIGDLSYIDNDNIRICSLSSSLSEVRLWSYYADGLRGIVLSIDFSGI
jgi:hypothetical protein